MSAIAPFSNAVLDRSARVRGAVGSALLIAGGAGLWLWGAQAGSKSVPALDSRRAIPAEAGTAWAPPASSMVYPVRSGAGTLRPTPPPELRSEIQSPPPITAHLEIRDTRDRLVQKRLALRTADRVYVRVGDGGPEWLFVQNPVDRRRASAVLMEHDRRTLVEYDESELRIVGLARGWAEIVSLGAQVEPRQDLQPTGDERELDGYRFKELRPLPGAKGPLLELWWNESLAVPLLLKTRNSSGVHLTRIVKVEPTVDRDLLADPGIRFPSYAVMDAADYREQHHEDH